MYRSDGQEQSDFFQKYFFFTACIQVRAAQRDGEENAIPVVAGFPAGLLLWRNRSHLPRDDEILRVQNHVPNYVRQEAED
jgi:hypothetical protein